MGSIRFHLIFNTKIKTTIIYNTIIDSLCKLTYPGLIGIYASRERLDELETQAIEVLKPFGENSVALKSLLEKVLRRDH